MDSNMEKDILDKWQNLYERCFTGEVFVYEENIYNGDILEEVIEVKFHPIYNENHEIIGASCLGTTITARKIDQFLIEDQNQKLRAIAWSQSHEIRGPLSRIMGLLYLLEHDDNLTEEQKEIIGYIKDSTIELDILIHKVVNLTEHLDSSQVNNNT
jgi:signal transduction histidine kinase